MGKACDIKNARYAALMSCEYGYAVWTPVGGLKEWGITAWLMSPLFFSSSMSAILHEQRVLIAVVRRLLPHLYSANERNIL